MTLLAPQNDLFRDTALAFSLLTRLPIKLADTEYSHSARAAWAYPLVGILSGMATCIGASLAMWLDLPLWCAALFALAASTVITGAMHEDGLADCADGFWGGWDPAMRLKIMKDSQIGTYGVLAILLSQGLRFGAILEILSWDSWILPLIAIHIASRAVMPALMNVLPHARDTGLSRSIGRVSTPTALKAVVIGAVGLVLGFGLFGVTLALIAAIAALAVGTLAKVKIGGQTGDVCGASQQVTEVTLLLALLVG